MSGERGERGVPSRPSVLHLSMKGGAGEGKVRRLELTPADGEGRYHCVLDGVPLLLDVRESMPGVLSLLVDGRAYRCVLDEGATETAVLIGGRRFVFAVEDPRSLTARRGKQGAGQGRQAVKAPMPGRIVRCLVALGDQVEAHQGVIVVEAMKMQNELKAVRAGKIVEIRRQPGETVAAGEVLVVIE